LKAIFLNLNKFGLLNLIQDDDDDIYFDNQKKAALLIIVLHEFFHYLIRISNKDFKDFFQKSPERKEFLKDKKNKKLNPNETGEYFEMMAFGKIVTETGKK